MLRSSSPLDNIRYCSLKDPELFPERGWGFSLRVALAYLNYLGIRQFVSRVRLSKNSARIIQKVQFRFLDKARCLYGIQQRIASIAEQPPNASPHMAVIDHQLFDFGTYGASPTLGIEKPLIILHGHSIEALKAQSFPCFWGSPFLAFAFSSALFAANRKPPFPPSTSRKFRTFFDNLTSGALLFRWPHFVLVIGPSIVDFSDGAVSAFLALPHVPVKITGILMKLRKWLFDATFRAYSCGRKFRHMCTILPQRRIKWPSLLWA